MLWRGVLVLYLARYEGIINNLGRLALGYSKLLMFSDYILKSVSKLYRSRKCISKCIILSPTGLYGERCR